MGAILKATLTRDWTGCVCCSRVLTKVYLTFASYALSGYMYRAYTIKVHQKLLGKEVEEEEEWEEFIVCIFEEKWETSIYLRVLVIHHLEISKILASECFPCVERGIGTLITLEVVLLFIILQLQRLWQADVSLCSKRVCESERLETSIARGLLLFMIVQFRRFCEMMFSYVGREIRNIKLLIFITIQSNLNDFGNWMFK